MLSLIAGNDHNPALISPLPESLGTLEVGQVASHREPDSGRVSVFRPDP